MVSQMDKGSEASGFASAERGLKGCTLARESANKLVHGCETVSTQDHRRISQSETARPLKQKRPRGSVVSEQSEREGEASTALPVKGVT